MSYLMEDSVFRDSSCCRTTNQHGKLQQVRFNILHWDNNSKQSIITFDQIRPLAFSFTLNSFLTKSTCKITEIFSIIFINIIENYI